MDNVVANNTNRGQNNSMCVDSDQNPQDIHYQEKVRMPKKVRISEIVWDQILWRVNNKKTHVKQIISTV